MSIVNIDFPGNLAQVDTATDLRGVPSSLISNGALYLVNGLQGLFEYNPGSVSVDDGTNIIRPNDKTPLQAGRWIRNVDGLASGPTGATGPANSTYTMLAALKAAPVSNASYIFAPPSGSEGGTPIGTFLYQTVGAPYTADGINVIKLDAVPLANGALVRQGAQSIAYQADPGSPLRSQSDVNANFVAVHEFRYVLETDDLAAFNRARLKGKPVRFVAGLGAGQGGAYLLNFAPLSTGLEIFGDGAATVIRPTVAANGNVFRGISASATTFIDDVTIRDLTLYGRVEEAGFSEPEHLVSMNGSRRFKLLRCTLKGARGDHFYLGSGVNAGDERHNFDTTIDSCAFDGIIRDNRNGISVIDGIGGTITNCLFTRLSRPNMPGPVDFEPDGLAFHRISDWTIENSRFDANDGNLAQIGFLVPSAVPLPARMTIRGNSFSNYLGTGADIAIDMRRVVADADYDMAFTIDDNSGVSGRRPFDLYAVKGVKITRTNVWQDYVGNALIGFGGTDQAAWDVDAQATLLRCGTSDVAGIRLANHRNVRVGGLVSKSGSANTGFPVQFSGGSSQGTSLVDLAIILNDGQTVAINNSSHTFTPATNQMRNVNTGGGTSQFQSQTEARATPTGANSWALGSSTVAYKNGEGRAVVDYDLSGGTLAAGTLVMSLPAMFRPRVAVYFVALSGTAFCGLRADPDGSVFITPNAAPAAALRGQFTFNTGQ